jgi:hypothetical protein
VVDGVTTLHREGRNPWTLSVSRTWDRGFESTPLQRRVSNEPSGHASSRSSCGRDAIDSVMRAEGLRTTKPPIFPRELAVRGTRVAATP